MYKIHLPLIMFLGLVSLMAHARSEVILAPIFTDNAVLQRDKPVPVWGKAGSGERVTVEFQGQKKEAVADADGRWQVVLDAMPASAEGSTMQVTGASGNVQIKGILVGEVWFCSGQSNMLHIVSKCLNPAEEKAAGNYPLIRVFKIWFNASEKPLDTFTAKPSKWSVCQPASVSSYPAVSYFFARDIYQKLGVPVGVINSSWGGTLIEPWMREESLKASPHADKIAKRWQEFLAALPPQYAAYEAKLAKWEELEKASPGQKEMKRPREPQGAVSRWTPSGLYNAMVHPIVPYAMRGILWYQGESSADRHDEYADLFKGLIQDWRGIFGQGELPFYFVQIANYDQKKDPTGKTWAFLREAQEAALSLPQTGMAVTIDIGDVKDAHYPNKQETARRLALLALDNVYGQDVRSVGPVFEKAVPEKGAMRVFLKAESDLVLKGTPPGGFELAGADMVFQPAEARLDGKALVVTSSKVPDPVAVRYAWDNAPATSVFDAAGLPAAPFRSDDWTPAPSGSADVTDAGNDAGE